MPRRLLTALRHALSPSALGTEGEYGYNSADREFRFHDGVRDRGVTPSGFLPHAFGIGLGTTQIQNVIITLAAAGGTVVTPMYLESHMMLDSMVFRSSDTSLARGPVEMILYEDRLNNSNTLSSVAGSGATLATFTPTVGSNRTITLATPIYLPPGCYWLALKNNHATNTLAVGATAAGTMALNVVQTKTLTTAAFGATLDFVAATWTKVATPPVVRLNGRVFGHTVAF